MTIYGDEGTTITSLRVNDDPILPPKREAVLPFVFPRATRRAATRSHCQIWLAAVFLALLEPERHSPEPAERTASFLSANTETTRPPRVRTDAIELQDEA